MSQNKKLNLLDTLQPVSAERFISSRNTQKGFELASPSVQSNFFEDQILNIENQLDEYLELMENKMKEISEQRLQDNLQFMNELKFIVAESKNNQQKKEGVFKILSLFLSYYGCWREAETLMRQIQSNNNLGSRGGSQPKREVYDIYDFILELIENENEMSKMMKVLFSQESRIQQEQREQMDTSSQIYNFKQNIFLAIIQTFNIRMNSINDEIFSWLIDNQKLRIIEIILENDRFSASLKQGNYQRMKKQERKMLKYLHQNLILKNYNNEIELILNMNENNLELLSSKYVLYIAKYERIPPNYILNRTLIKQVVYQQNVPLMSAMLKLDRVITQQTLHSKKVQAQINVFLSQADTFCMGLYFLKKMSQKKQIISQSSEYLETILRLLEKPKSDEKFAFEIFSHVLHPLILCLVASKILLKLSFFKNPFSSEMLKLAKYYLERALLFRDTIFDAREMSLILFKPLFPSDKPLVKALRNRNYCQFFTEFFIHPCITYLLEQKWMSTYGFDYSLLSTFTPLCHFQKQARIKNTIAKGSKSSSSSTSSFQKSMKSTGSSASFSLEPQKQNWIIFRDIEVSQLKKATKNNHFYQFVIYNKSVQVRTFFEFILFLAIFCFTLYELFLFIENLNSYASVDDPVKIMLFSSTVPQDWQSKVNDFKKQNPTPPPLDIQIDNTTNLNIQTTDPQIFCKLILYQISSGYQEFMDFFQSQCVKLIYVGTQFEKLCNDTIRVLWFIFCIGANAIQKQIYVYLIRRKTDPQILDLYDLLLYIACGSFLLTKQIFIPEGISANYTFEYFNNCQFALKIECCAIVFILWLRMFIFLIRTQKFGLLVKVIILFTKDLLYFMVILITVTVAFGLINYILFQNSLELYKSIDKSIFNLFAAAFGAFDFNNQTGIQSAILIVFLVVVNVILLNLLIAILNTRYEKTMQQSEMEYSLVVYNDYINSRFNPIYMSMISLPPPFNILNFIFGIISFITKSRIWNKIALKIGYTLVIFLPCILLYIALSLVLIPFSYLYFIHQVSMYSFSDNMMYARKKNKCFKITLYLFRLLTWITLGIPYLLVVFFSNDLPLFCKSAFAHNNNKYNFTKNPVLDLRVIKYVSLYSNYLNLAKKDVFNYLEFRSSLEQKKEVKYKKSYFQRFAQPSIKSNSQPLQQIRKGFQNNVKHNFKSETIFEKNFNDAVKKFGDSKVKQEVENIQLNNLLKAIKYSAIFFKKSKSTSFNLSKLLYIVKKKEINLNLLQLNTDNFFLNRSFSSQPNINVNNLN
ncbi:polycystin cation channel protein (macronuclear) [Tetrahymena thermophila SB210]|uniref:Polycystin cation channel protein n=1 Tax=Tetrahymena thermophila (strain SB210) TaxID=312017 RepID=Q22YP3_TETTS|nr:polycystin cation channel protein [Tetrahymena thermophila SB210]EAR90628.2 polycystin cation channel protein [Tetrahymena thermophila SB210]|eukprot:XP_001010873.2 polycystin cation channel protein [Tetrahymena thermophila SB210]